MKFSHCEEVRNERLLDILTDEDRGLRIIVSRHGAELVSLARRDANGSWTGFLYRDNEIDKPASGWGNHATVMEKDFPIFNRIYPKYFAGPGKPNPTRTTVEVGALPTPIAIELKVIAVCEGGG